MKNFVIVCNSGKDDVEKVVGKIIGTIEKFGCNCSKVIYSKKTEEGKFVFADPNEVPSDTEAILSLGGDGTFIHAAKDLISLNVPIFGINYGTLGFLAEVDVEGFEDSFKSLLLGDFIIEERTLMRGKVTNGETVKCDKIALNDIAMNRSTGTSIANYELSIDGHYLNTYSADGIVLSTPTGSTGYNLSAGGPIVLPTSEIFLATPVCAHTLNSRSIVFPADAVIGVVPKIGLRDRIQQYYLSFDGEMELMLEQGDVIEITKAEVTTKIIKVNRMSFIEHLGEMMR